MMWTNKGEYRGQFVNGEKEGDGIYEGVDGEQYEGQWKNNLKHGKGKNSNKDGVIIEGEFFKNKPHGDVEITFPYGEKYKGSINMGVRDG